MKRPPLSGSVAQVAGWRQRRGRDPRDARGTQSPAAPPRSSSYTRIRLDDPASESGAPSTLPPPPFWNETSVAGLEWWLDAHMGLASGLLWVAHLLDTVLEGDAHAETMRRLVAHTDAVRDALYELYCDAADGRMAPLLGRGAALEHYVRGSYAWCVRVVGLLATVTNGLRGEAGPDWAVAKAEFRASTGHYPTVPPMLRDLLRSLPIDFASPTEPLRNLPLDLEQLVAAMIELQGTLAKRFNR
jgi:hypothetical protein